MAGVDGRYSLDGIQQYAMKNSARVGSGNDFPYDRDDRGEINVWEAVAEAIGLPVNFNISNRAGRANNYIPNMMGGHTDPGGAVGPEEDQTPSDDEIERAGRAEVWEALEQFVEECLTDKSDEDDFVEREVVDLPAEKTWRGLNPPEER